MPTVPTITGPSRTPGVSPAPQSPRVRDTAPPTPGQVPTVPAVRTAGLGGQQAADLGAAVADFGARGGRVLEAWQTELNELRFREAAARAKERALALEHDPREGYTNLRGVDALDRPSKRPLADEYLDRLREGLDDIEGGLGNDAQRQAFRQYRAELEGGFRAGAMRHESDQVRDYALGVTAGEQALAQRAMTIAADLDQVAANADQLRLSVLTEARVRGMPPEWVEARTLELVSGAHQTNVMGAIDQGRLDYAEAYIRRFGGQMDGASLVRAREALESQRDIELGRRVADEVLRLSEPMTDFDRAFRVLIDTESRGRQFDRDGNPLRSPAGAIGIAQVMPGTGPEAARLAGLEWDEHRYKHDEAYNLALGRAYFEQQVRDFGGDLRKGWAAYNAGPERLQKALRRAETEGGDWLRFMPQETRDYVARNQRIFDRSRAAAGSLEDTDEMIRTHPDLAGRPERIDYARQEYDRRARIREHDARKRGDAAVAAAIEALDANGGDYGALPASVREAIPPEQRGTVRTYADRVASRPAVESDPETYAILAAEPEKVRAMSHEEFMALKPYLSDADFKTFARQRGQAEAGTGTAPPKWETLSTDEVSRGIKVRLDSMGIATAGRDADPARLGAIRQFIDSELLAIQRGREDRLTGEGLNRELDRIFQRVGPDKRFWGGDTTQPIVGMDISDIPDDDLAAIRDDFKRRGIPDPTDAQILLTYWKVQDLPNAEVQAIRREFLRAGVPEPTDAQILSVYLEGLAQE